MKKYLLLVSIIAVAAYVNCGGENNAPVINSVTANPSSTYPGENVTLTCDAEDEDGDLITYSWSAEAGTLSATNLSSVIWTAPNDTGNFTIEVIVEDEGELVDTGSVTVRVDPNWVYGENMTPVLISDFTWSYSQIIISGAPTGAEVDSVAIAVSITHSDPSDLDIWLESPDSTQLLIWDNNYPGGIEVFVTDFFAGKDVNGTWTLWVYDGYWGGQGTLNSWAISILWKF